MLAPRLRISMLPEPLCWMLSACRQRLTSSYALHLAHCFSRLQASLQLRHLIPQPRCLPVTAAAAAADALAAVAGGLERRRCRVVQRHLLKPSSWSQPPMRPVHSVSTIF
jgi:hypothetical protein